MEPAVHNIVLLGLGAIGTIYASRLVRVPTCTFRVLFDPVRHARFLRDGIFFNGEPLSLETVSPPDKPFPADLVLLATKATGLDAAIPLLREVVRPGTILLPLLNGISAAGRLARAYPEACVLPGFFLGHASSRDRNRVTHDGVGRLYLGPREDTEAGDCPELRAVCRVCDEARIDYECPSDFPSALWRKYILNVGINQTSAVFCASYGQIQASPDLLEFAEALMREAAQVAEALAVHGATDMPEQALSVILSMPSGAKTSMLQDIEAMRPTEVDLFAGELCRMGRRLGISTPRNAEVLLRLNACSGN